MAGERVEGPPREIKFGGEGKAESIKRGFAVTTLRNPRDAYNFAQGEVIMADCFDDGEKVPVVVLSNETKRLKDFSAPQLALDGFFSASQAADEMKTWTGYEKTRTTTKMQAITFVTKEAYDSLPDAYKRNLTNRNFDNLVHHRELRHFFFPTMCFHLTNLGGNAEDWSDFLYIATNLINPEERMAMESFEIRGTNAFRLMKDHPDMFHKISMAPTNSLFKPLVLAMFEV